MLDILVSIIKLRQRENCFGSANRHNNNNNNSPKFQGQQI